MTEALTDSWPRSPAVIVPTATVPQSRAHRRQQQPHVDGGTASDNSPATVSPTLRKTDAAGALPTAGGCSRPPPPRARRRPCPPPTPNQPRMSPASQHPTIHLERSQDVPLELLVELLGRRLVGHRQQDRQRELGRAGPTPGSPMPGPVGEWFRTASDDRESSGAPSTVTRTSSLRLSPRIVIDRQRTIRCPYR